MEDNKTDLIYSKKVDTNKMTLITSFNNFVISKLGLIFL